MTVLEFWELLSYVVTVIALPLAIFTFWREQRQERENEEEETYQLLSDAYTDFLKLVMANPDLQLRSTVATPTLSDEQRERRQVVFEMLVSLFERAYLLAFDTEMTEKQSAGGSRGTTTCASGAGGPTFARCCHSCSKARTAISPRISCDCRLRKLPGNDGRAS